MIFISTKKISRSADNLIKSVEKELQSKNEVYIDPKINKSIEREISHLGKEKLIVDHINNLTKKFNKSKKNKILFLLVRLYNYNKQVHQSLIRELKGDKKLLNKRIKTKIDKNKVHKDVYKKLLSIANTHYNFVKHYAKTFNPKKKYLKAYILKVVYHKRKAEAIYKALTNVKMRMTLHKVLLKKLDTVYQALINFTAELAKEISLMVKDVKDSKAGRVSKRTKNLQSIVSDKIGVLRNFAIKYTYNIIHSEKFLDFDNNKIVLISKKG